MSAMASSPPGRHRKQLWLRVISDKMSVIDIANTMPADELTQGN